MESYNLRTEFEKNSRDRIFLKKISAQYFVAELERVKLLIDISTWEFFTVKCLQYVLLICNNWVNLDYNWYDFRSKIFYNRISLHKTPKSPDSKSK